MDFEAAKFLVDLARDVEQEKRKVTRLTNKVNKIGVDLMATIQDIQAKITQLQTDVAENQTVIGSAKVLLNGLSAQVAELKTQLQDAIANGADPAALQGIVDGLQQVSESIDNGTDDLSTALVQNTPSEE